MRSERFLGLLSNEIHMLSLNKTKVFNNKQKQELSHAKLSLAFKQSRDEFEAYLQASEPGLDRTGIIERLRLSLKNCVQLPIASLTFSMKEYLEAASLKDAYTFPSLQNCPWIARYPMINGISTLILCDLSALVVDVGWDFFDKLCTDSEQVAKTFNFQKKDGFYTSAQDGDEDGISEMKYIHCSAKKIMYSLFNKTLEYSKANLLFAHDAFESDKSLVMDDTPSSSVEMYLTKSEANIANFYSKLAGRDLLAEKNIYFIEKMLHMGYFLRANLQMARADFEAAEYFLSLCDIFNKKHCLFLQDDPELLCYGYGDVSDFLECLRSLTEKIQKTPVVNTDSLDNKKKKKKRSKNRGNSKQALITETDYPADTSRNNALGVEVTIDENNHIIVESVVPDDEKSDCTMGNRFSVDSPGLSDTTNESENRSAEIQQIGTCKEREKERRRLKKERKEADRIKQAEEHRIKESDRLREEEHKNRQDHEDTIQHFKSLVSPTDRLPACFQNEQLKSLLDEISVYFDMSSREGYPCEGYLFGSANIKKSPGDFDIFIPNIKSKMDMEKVNHLVSIFMRFGAEVEPMDSGTREYGYRKEGGHTIPIRWAKFLIELNITDKLHFVEHAKNADYTVNILYYCFSDKILYQINSAHSLDDLDNKLLRTISNPELSFRYDLRRVFRGVRLMASEGFDFSTDGKDAIKALFLNENAFINHMTSGKFNYQLDRLLASGYVQENLVALDQLRILSQLLMCLTARPDGKAKSYSQKLEPYLLQYQRREPMQKPALVHRESFYNKKKPS